MVSYYGFIQRTVNSMQIISITYLFFILLEKYSRRSRMPSTQKSNEGVKKESESRAKVSKGLISLLFFKNFDFQFPSRVFFL